MFYYAFHIGDYQSHTSHLSEIEDLAYRRMLDWCYLHEKHLPIEVDEIARQIRMRTHTDSIALVLQEFFVLSSEGWISPRIVEAIVKVGDKSKKATASAMARWGKINNEIKDLAVDANALRTQSESNATHYPEPITQNPLPKEKKQRGSRLPVDFVLHDEWIAFCKQERPDLNAHKTFDAFKDYWVAAPKGIKLDWFATWRNWVRNQSVAKQSTQQLTFAERDEMAKRKRWEERTGRKWDDDENNARTIDASFSFLEIK